LVKTHSTPKPAAPQQTPPVEKPIVHHAQPVEPPKERPHHTVSTPSSDSDPAPVSHSHRHRKGEDFYDYAGQHEGGTGDPTPLPVKDWSPN
jgi:hypothetical protein